MSRETRDPSAARVLLTFAAVGVSAILLIAGLSALAGGERAGRGEQQDRHVRKPGEVAPPAESTSVPSPATVPGGPAPPTDRVPSDLVVAIDAGHQGRADKRREPVGPGASASKPRVSGGAVGVETGFRESRLNLDVALRLRKALEARGVKVVMVRESEDVDLGNAQRAEIANRAHADLFLRLHADGSANQEISGVQTLIPARNRWTRSIVASSAEAGLQVHGATLAATGAEDRGVTDRSDLTGFNWSRVPTVLVEMGFLSNRAEERRLLSAGYQERLADGIADGTMDYLEAHR